MMKNGECIECGKPLFDQSENGNSRLCDECNNLQECPECGDKEDLVDGLCFMCHETLIK